MPSALPTAIRPDIVEFHLESNALIFESPLNRTRDVAELAGDRWRATLTFRNLRRSTSDVRALLHFIAALRGPITTFFLWDHSRETPQGNPQGTPLIKGASQTGTSVTTDGWTASQTGLLLPGDLIEFGAELKEITQQVDSDGFGDATINFFPPIRNAPADNAPITTSSPKGTFRLRSKEDGMPHHHGSLVDLQFTALEDV